jgi:hypothetical protein
LPGGLTVFSAEQLLQQPDASSRRLTAAALRERGQLVADAPELGKKTCGSAAEHLDRRALGADHGVADHARDDLVVADPPEVDPLVQLDQRLGELVQLLVLAPWT